MDTNQMKHDFRQRLLNRQPLIGTIVSSTDPAAAEVLAACGFDWLFIDMEHGAIDIASCYNMITATSGSACSPVVRVMEPSIAFTKPVLDSGAMGVIFPMITSKETAEAAVAAVRYPPAGERGWGPFYAPMRCQKKDSIDYYKSSDDIVIISLIEHIDAINNIEEITKVKGIDVFFIAPMDLAASMGYVGDRDHPEVKEAIARAEACIKKSHGSLGGLCLSASEGNDKIQNGYQVLLMGFDLLLMEVGVRSMLDGLNR